MTHFSELMKTRGSIYEQETWSGTARRDHLRSIFSKKLSDDFHKIKTKCPNWPENQELGPILGQNGDPDLIKLFPALLGKTKTFKNKK